MKWREIFRKDESRRTSELPRTASLKHRGLAGTERRGFRRFAAAALSLTLAVAMLPAGFGSEETYAKGTDTNYSQVNPSVAKGARSKYTKLRGKGKDKVTLMVYMIGTDLESQSGMATSDLNEMVYSGIDNPNVNIIVETGGCRRWNNSVIPSDRITRWSVNGKGLQMLDQQRSSSMTDPDMLSDFIQFASEQAPADRYMLILWDHGGGSVTGYGYDELYPNGSMDIGEVASALKTGGVKFDFVGFDACLMATLETAIALEPYSDYLIASEESEPGTGWYYTNWLKLLDKNSSTDTLELGRKILDDFTDASAQSSYRAQTTLSLIDLSEINSSVMKAFSAFGGELSTTLKSTDSHDFQEIAVARNGSREFAQSSHIDQVDLVDFATRVGGSKGKALSEAIQSAVKYNRVNNISNAYGMSIFFPMSSLRQMNSMISIYDDIGMDQDWQDSVCRFAQLESSGQITANSGASYGSTSGSLLETLLGGTSYGSGSGSGGSFGSGSSSYSDSDSDYYGSSSGLGSLLSGLLGGTSSGSSSYGSSSYGSGSSSSASGVGDLLGSLLGGSSSGSGSYGSGSSSGTGSSAMDLLGSLLGSSSGSGVGSGVMDVLSSLLGDSSSSYSSSSLSNMGGVLQGLLGMYADSTGGSSSGSSYSPYGSYGSMSAEDILSMLGGGSYGSSSYGGSSYGGSSYGGSSYGSSSYGSSSSGSGLSSLLNMLGGYTSADGTSYGGMDYGTILGGSNASPSSDLLSQAAQMLFGRAMVGSDQLKVTEKDDQNVLILDEDKWEQVLAADLEVFVDDGNGYIDLGLDNVAEYNDDGDLIDDWDGTWLTLNGEPVAIYPISDEDDDDDGLYITRKYIPAFLNDQRVRLIAEFNEETGTDSILGAEEVLDTGVQSKGLIEIQPGDTIQLICDYYHYDGTFDAQYTLGNQITVPEDGTLTLANQAIEGNAGDRCLFTYRLTDIYQARWYLPMAERS